MNNNLILLTRSVTVSRTWKPTEFKRFASVEKIGSISTTAGGIKKQGGIFKFKFNKFEGELIEIGTHEDVNLMNVNEIIQQSKPQFIITDTPGGKRPLQGDMFGSIGRNITHWYTYHRYIGYDKIFKTPVIDQKPIKFLIKSDVPIYELGPSDKLLKTWLKDDFRYKWTFDFIENSAPNEVMHSIHSLPSRGIPLDHPLKLLTPPPRTTKHADVYNFLRLHPYFIDQMRNDIRQHVLTRISKIIDEHACKSADQTGSFMIFARKIFALVLAQEIDRSS